MQVNAAPAEPMLIAEAVELRDTKLLVDEDHARKQPDWTYDEVDSGKAPAERLADHTEQLNA
jgi:hypothetical protein